MDFFRRLNDNVKWALTGTGIGLATVGVAGLLFIGINFFWDDEPTAEELVAQAADLNASFFAVCEAEQYQFTPKVREAFLTYAKVQARSDLKAMDKDLPKRFLKQLEEDPMMEACIYAATDKPAHVLLNLYSLRLDLGEDNFEKYNQLAMASAFLTVTNAPNVDISDRKPLVLTIGGDPRKRVDTRATNRKLDFNDHVINFLEDHTISEEVVVGAPDPIPQFRYDQNGKFVPPTSEPKPKPDPNVKTMRTRSLRASDVLANTEWQQKFNAYMTAKGFPTNIQCGEKIIHWGSSAMVRGQEHKNLGEAYMMFRKAYEAKGLLPKERDPHPTHGERLAYLIRNDQFTFPEESAKKRNWPRFPLQTPWPILTMLVANDQPLREREERWQTFVSTGEFKTYGEYIGSIAQQHDMQSARRLAPYPFHYHTIQMMMKDGGVCGTMGNISARSHSTLGIPSSTAHQPGHCAVVAFQFDAKKKMYSCRGSQYVTGGDDKTWPHRPWTFEKEYSVEGKSRKGMVYHQSLAWAANYGMAEFMDSLMAYRIYKLLPKEQQATDGHQMLKSGLAINPCNFLLADKFQDGIKTPGEYLGYWGEQTNAVAKAAARSGCPADGLYLKTLKNKMYAQLAELPAPTNNTAAAGVLAFLEKEKCDNAKTLVTYRLAAEGMQGMLQRVEREMALHLGAVQQNPGKDAESGANAISAIVDAAIGKIPDAAQRKTWATKLWLYTIKRPKYFGNKSAVLTHPLIPILARHSGAKMPKEEELLSPLLYQLTNELQISVNGNRTEKSARALSLKIKSAAGKIEDIQQRNKWYRHLYGVMFGKTLLPIQRDGKSVKDPCAVVIQDALKTPPTAAN